MRQVPDNRELLVSDTVGFIDRPPHALVAAFRHPRTGQADLIVHVIDWRRRIANGGGRRERGAAGGGQATPVLDAAKSDAITAEEQRRLLGQDASALSISALRNSGIEELIETIASRLALDVVRLILTFDPDSPSDRERIARVYRHARVLEHETRDGLVSIAADVPRRLVDRLSGSNGRPAKEAG